jgi:hypothetical protein
MSHSPAIAEWDNDYARVARVASQLRTQGLSSRNNNNNNYNSYYNNNAPVGGQQQQQQQQLHHHLNRLDAALSTLPLASAEIQRRRRLIHHLRGGTALGGITSSSTTTRTPNSMSSTATSGDGLSFMGGQQQQLQQPMSHMSAAMQQQDEMIDELAVGISRLKDQSQVIGDEARMHVNLLGEMETNLAAAHSGLDEETKRAAKLKEDQSVWKLQLIVAGETVLFVLLLFLGLSP